MKENPELYSDLIRAALQELEVASEYVGSDGYEWMTHNRAFISIGYALVDMARTLRETAGDSIRQQNG